MNDSQKTEERAETALTAQTVAWSYEWYGNADEEPKTRWHKRLSNFHPTDGLPASDCKDYRNIRPLAFADEALAAPLGADSPEPPDDGELEAWRSTADALLRCASSDAGLTRRAALLLQNAYLFGSKLREHVNAPATKRCAL